MLLGTTHIRRHLRLLIKRQRQLDLLVSLPIIISRRLRLELPQLLRAVDLRRRHRSLELGADVDPSTTALAPLLIDRCLPRFQLLQGARRLRCLAHFTQAGRRSCVELTIEVCHRDCGATGSWVAWWTHQ